MFVGVIRKGHSLQGYITGGLVETHNIQTRHDALAREMEERGYTHSSGLTLEDVSPAGEVDSAASFKELTRRCTDCDSLYSMKLEADW